MDLLSERLNSFHQSLTVKISQKARDLKKQGKEIISLSSGEPDFDTPQNIKDQAIKAIENGFTKYTTVDGIISLKTIIKEKFLKENGIEFSTDQITVGVGGKHVIYNLFMSTLNHMDEVIIPAPYWVSYPDIVSLCGGKPVIVKTKMSENFKIKPAEIEKVITKKTKWLVINSPSNPTGIVYSKDELKAISEILLDKKIYVLSDDIYEHILYEKNKFYNILNVEPKLYKRTFIVNGVSKAFSMTGWRIGYGAGSKEIIKAIAKIQSQSTTNPTSISQIAAVEALSAEKTFLEEWIKKFAERKQLILKFVDEIQGLECINPSGAFYMFISCSKIMNKTTPDDKVIKSDLDFANFLLTYSGVAVVPGVAFGASPFIRISYAVSLEILKKACKKMKKAISLLK